MFDEFLKSYRNFLQEEIENCHGGLETSGTWEYTRYVQGQLGAYKMALEMINEQLKKVRQTYMEDNE